MRSSPSFHKDKLFIANHRRKIEAGQRRDPDDAAGFQDAVERSLQRFRELGMLHADSRQLIVRHEDAAIIIDARGDGR